MPRPRKRSRTNRSLTQPSNVAWFRRRRNRWTIRPAGAPSARARNGVASTSLTSASYRGAKRFGIGSGIERVQLARERERIGEVVAAERAEVDAVRARDGEAADRTVRIAEVHYRPLKSGSRFSMKAAIPSFWSSEAKSR